MSKRIGRPPGIPNPNAGRKKSVATLRVGELYSVTLYGSAIKCVVTEVSDASIVLAQTEPRVIITMSRIHPGG